MIQVWNTTERQWNARKEHKPLIFNILYLKNYLAFTIPRELKSKSIIHIGNIIHISFFSS